MLRRQAISLLLGSLSPTASLNRFLDPRNGCALLIDVRSRRILAANGSTLAGEILLPPGSTVKPFTLAALLASGKLRSDANFVCPGQLTLAGRRVDCSHPRMISPIRIDTALAYSCNCFVANAAGRFARGELAPALMAAGLTITPAATAELQQLQAIGEASVLVTPLGLAHAYRQLAVRLTRAMPQILTGLEGAVEFGTAQLARIAWATLAGKTGTTLHRGQSIAWFAGFTPSRAPELVVTVMVSGRHGGSDAAPIAAQILDAWHAGRL